LLEADQGRPPQNRSAPARCGLYALSEIGAKTADGTIRVPDLAVLADSDQLGWDQMTLPASAYHTLVEVVSEDSEIREKVTKAEEYAKAGLPRSCGSRRSGRT